MDDNILIYFLSPGCPVCKSLLPVVQEIETQEPGFQVRYASDGETTSAHERYATEHGIPVSNYLLSRELGISLAVNKLPFAALINRDGVLRARGLVNNREHLESLLAADELDVSSLQEYLGLAEEPNHQ
jgi:methylamine dehydrogenase accessory protein MauD